MTKSPRSSQTLLKALATTAIACALLVPLAGASTADAVGELEVVGEFLAPGTMVELSGIYPHPENDDLYYVVANNGPVYAKGQTPKLPADLRGKLLTVDRAGDVVASLDLVEGEYGGMAFGDGHLFVSSLEPAEILKVDLAKGEVVDRFDIAGPAGGLDYVDGRLYAQLFVGYPHLAVIDASSGETVDTMWSDESAMGLATVDGDLLCTWSNGFTDSSSAELRLLDSATGKVLARRALDRVHTSMAPTDSGFFSLVSTGDSTGNLVVREYAYRAVAR